MTCEFDFHEYARLAFHLMVVKRLSLKLRQLIATQNWRLG